ncbi:MAG: DUF418 domain-containing protein [Dermatophilaceae bacterium]
MDQAPERRPPTNQSERIGSLDLLRGIAILGTLATNIWIFTDPEGLVGFINRPSPDTTEAVLRQLANGKFLGLLTVMFGIGLEIQRQSARRHSRSWPGTYPVRAGLLFLDGVVHYLLVVEFDVLMGYAVTGAVVAYLLVTSPRAQRRWVVAMTAVHVLMLTAVTAALLAAPPIAPEPLRPNPYADGSWWELVLFRIDNAALFRAEVVVILPLSVATFLLGAWLYRAGVFTPAGAALRRRLVVAGLMVALPVDLVLGTAGGTAGLIAARYGTAPIVALGLLALVIELDARRRRTGWMTTSLTAVGRAALSCYVLQNVVASVLCYGWGLGLAARLGVARVPGTVVVYLAVAAVVVLAARWWLRRFDRGPVEWLWHRSHDALAGPR